MSERRFFTLDEANAMVPWLKQCFGRILQLRSQLQYDSISRQMNALLRYRWEYAPGSEVFAAVGEAARITGAPPSLGYHSYGSELLLRLGHRFQF